jgi:hypothetical protein
MTRGRTRVETEVTNNPELSRVQMSYSTKTHNSQLRHESRVSPSNQVPSSMEKASSRTQNWHVLDSAAKTVPNISSSIRLESWKGGGWKQFIPHSLLDATGKVDLEVNAKATTCMLTSLHRTAEQSQNLMTFIYINIYTRTTATNENFIRKENKSRLNSSNV